jgi:UDP-3-O-[3-hydroxymyristoyl] glucosamine N-acyltransferase
MPSSSPERPISITTGELSVLLGAELQGAPTITLTHFDALESARPGALSYIRSARYAKAWMASKASAALVNRDITLPEQDVDESPFHGPRALLMVPDADLAMIKVLDVFAARPALPEPGIHPSAIVDKDAQVSPTASIGPGCTIGPRAVIGENTRLVGHVYIASDVKVGARCTLHPGAVVLDRCVIGNDCILHPSVSIGADGFGYRPAPDGRGLIKIPHIGNVVIGDFVEIGASSCVDRAKFGSTTIGSGTKIDNLVQIAHGCRIGRSCVICGHVGIAGSVIVGNGVIIGGKVGIADNVEVGDGAKLAAFSGVTSNVPAGASWMGAPAAAAGEWRRTYAALRRMGKARSQVREQT